MAQLDQFTETTAKRLGILARAGWLARQPADFQDVVARLGRWKTFEAGETIFLAGDEPDGLFGLGEGILEMTFPLIGEEPVVVHRAEPGFWIGEAAILMDQKRFITVSAATRARVFVIPSSSVRRIVEEKPRHWRSFYDQCLTNQMTTLTLLAEALSLSPRARVARILLRLARSDGSVPGSQEDLGRLLGMTRSSVRRALSSLIEVGAVTSGYGVLSIRDRTMLERLVFEA
jgi:CRP/FNR family transcriptional regulator, cyclic AMP receptor protein